MGKDTTVEAPDVPDPNTIAATDAAYNRINTFTPFGNLTYSGPNLNNATISLPQAQQQQLDYQNQITGNTLQAALSRQAGLPSGGFDFSGLPSIGDSDSELEQATFDRVANLLRPEFGREQDRLESSLLSRGIPTNSSLYDQESDRFARQRDEALQQAALAAVGVGREEAARQRATGLGEQVTERGTLFNELQALLGAQQTAIPGTQSFFAPTQTDVAGAYGIGTGAAQNVFNTQQQAASQKYGDTANLVGQFAGGGK